MTTIATTLANNIYSPVTPIPAGALEVVVTPASGYTVVTTSDLYSASVPTTPLGTLTNVFNGSLTLPTTYFGMSHHYSPSSIGDDPQISSSVVRTHDYILSANSGSSTRWHHIEKNAPVGGVHSYDFSILDVFVKYHVAQGHDIVHTLAFTPAWASARPTEAGNYGLGTAAEPSDMTNWDAYCTATATQYKGRIKYYEIWNEPNTTKFYTGTAAKLSEMVRRANQAIKAVDPDAIILSPPVMGMQTGGTGIAYFNSMMAASDGATGTMKDWVDIIGCHFYTTGYTTINTLATDILPNIRTAMTTSSVSTKPLWNTEFGMFNPNLTTLTKSQREAVIRRMMTLVAFSNQGGVARSIWYAKDDGVMGFNSDDVAVWEDHRKILTSGPTTVVNLLRDGRVAAVINGKQYLW